MQQTEIDIGQCAAIAMKVKGYPDFLVVDGTTVWVTNEGRIDQLKESDPSPGASIFIPEPCGAGIARFGSLWIASCRDKSIYRIDKKSAEIQSIIKSGLADAEGELSIAAGAGAIWVLSDKQGILSRIDPETNKVVNHIDVKAGSSCAVFGYGSVWVSNPALNEEYGTVQRIDPTTDKVIATITVGRVPHFLTAGEGGVWTLNQGDGTVTHIDPETNHAIGNIETGAAGNGGDIAAGGGKIWVRGTKVLLTAIDPVLENVVAVYGPPCGSGAVRVTENNKVWISAHDVQTVWVLEL